MKRIVILMFVLFSFPGYSQVKDQKAIALLDEVSKKAKSYKTIKVDFSFTMVNKQAKINESKTGTLLISGDKYRLTVAGQTVISDGKTIWTFIKESNEIQVNDLDNKDDAMTPSKLLTSYNANYKSKIVKDRNVTDPNLEVVELLPNTTKNFTKAMLTIDKVIKQVKSFALYDKNGNIFTYKVTKFTTDFPLNNSDFIYDPKQFPGAEVIDMKIIYMISGKITDLHRLREISRNIRKSVIESLAEAGSGHLGGSLGLADVFTSLYFGMLNHDPSNPAWESRDRVILSAGHLAPILYATLAHAGYFPVEELLTLRKLGSRLQGHPGRDHGLPGLELSAGSLGQGLSVAVGRAIAGKMDKKSFRVFSIHGDGELQEGSIWEAAMSASHHHLDNLVAIVDRNSLQIDGPTEKVMALEPLADKWKAFGWNVLICNGHDHEAILSAFLQAASLKEKPTVMIANTIMGKGVKSIEGDYHWHGKAPLKGQAGEFLKELY